MSVVQLWGLCPLDYPVCGIVGGLCPPRLPCLWCSWGFTPPILPVLGCNLATTNVFHNSQSQQCVLCQVLLLLFPVLVYDILTGRVVSRLDGHRACVRDVSWHPYNHQLISTSVSVQQPVCSDITVFKHEIPLLLMCPSHLYVTKSPTLL